MIPKFVNGEPVKYYSILEEPIFPSGYPGDGNLDKTKAFLISVSNEINQEDKRYYVSCLGMTGKIMAGDMYFTLEDAMSFPLTEFEIKDLKWKQISC